MSDSEYSEPLDVNGQDEGEANEIRMKLLQQQQQCLEKQEQSHLQQQNINYMSYAGSTSSSGESSISSSSCDESDEGDAEDALELAKINNVKLSLPRGLCENLAIFQEFFSLETWQELPLPVQNHLHQFLPNFHNILPPHLAAVEQTRTISMLFNNKITRFGESPLRALQQQLDIGNYRPDIVKLRQNILKSQRREQRFQECERLSQTAKQLFISRQKLLDITYKSSPDTIIKCPSTHNTQQPKPSHLFTDNKLSAMRARKRFYSEISKISHQVGLKDDTALSADEEDNDDFLAEEVKKEEELKQQLLEDTNENVKTSLADRCIYSTVFKKQQDIDNEEAIRFQQKAKQLKLTNRNFKEYLREHKRRKITEPTLPEFETSDIRLRDVCARAQMGGNFKRMFAFGKTPGRKSKTTLSTTTATPAYSTTNLTAVNATSYNVLTATTTITTTTTTTFAQPITLSTLSQQSLPLPKLSEPPALVPIQSTLKKSDTHKVRTFAAKSALKDYHHQTQEQHQHPLATPSLNNSHATTNDTLNISQLISVSNHNDHLGLCIDDSSLLTSEHDAFNMLDNDVELQQEEVETFGSTCEETIPAFVIGSETVPDNESNNDTKSNLMNARSKGGNQLQQIENISQPLPKLEPISRSPLRTAKQSSSINNSALVSELIQETHASYFSLIRDFFCATPNHRMRYDDLRNKIDVWLRNPITALNEWYTLAENWSNLLKSAVNFLVGVFPDLPEEYVPYIEHKMQLNIYQWIGAGRDSDTRLSELCTLWMEKRSHPNDKNLSALNATQNDLNFEMCPRSSVENDDSHEAIDSANVFIPPPPPPRCPTNWSVRAATLQEISEFQRQERARFEQPHKAYTYRMHGYESVVGPVKGIYTPLLALSKARGHSMMVGDRPNFVTILTLVRDATARLPNGEGTRAEISELLKCSQYINRDASENVLQTIVSGALDRMHTEHDPCVRYEPKRKIWIYLHRNRTEDEFERIHQQNQTIGKSKKLPQRKPKPMTGSCKSTSVVDDDSFSLIASTESSNGSSAITGTLLTMPALVPSNPIIVSNSNVTQRQQQVQQQHIITTNKCPPVPPLKYNIPPSQTSNSQQQQQQQQKSLLKTAIRAENQKTTSQSNAAALSSNLIKQHNFQMPQSKSGPNQNTTPIIVATPQGLQTVHVSNATSVISSQTINHQQQQQQQTSSSQQHSNITANLAGKRVTLNKPIIINQVTATSPTPIPSSSSPANQKQKTPQLVQKTQLLQNRITLQTNQHQTQQQRLQQQQSNLVIPISMANNMSLNVHQTSNVTDHNSSTSVQANQSLNNRVPVSLSNKQNIIRLVSASNVKSLMNSSTTNPIVNRQRIFTTATATTTERSSTPQLQLQQKSQTGIQLLSNNSNVVTVSGAPTNPAGSIVKMSPQQFASFQQKQSQQQHIIVKQAGVNKTQTAGSKPQRVILGNTAIVSQTRQGKNIIMQQIPVASSSVVVTPSQTTTVSSAVTAMSSGNKMQTINAKSLTPQQQRVLIQNLKQQQQQQQTLNQNQIQFKTVQVVGNTSATQRPQTVTLATTQQALPKGVVVVSRDNGATTQHNLTRILKTTSPQIKPEISTATAGTRVITSSSGQIISLDNLIQKQGGGTLRITGSGNTTQTIKGIQQQHIPTNILQKAQPQQVKQQQQPQQFAIVSVPNSIISLNSSSNFTVGQRIITTQAGPGNTTTLVNLDTTKVTPSIVSTGSGRVITATAAGTKIITKQLPVNASAGNIRVINTVNQTASLNLATLQGKQVVLATGKTLNAITKTQLQSHQLQQHQNVVQTPGSIVIGGQTVKLQQGNTNFPQLFQKNSNIIPNQNSTSSTPSPQLQTVIMGNQILRVQQIPQMLPTANRLSVSNAKTISNNVASSITTTNSNTPKTIFVGSTGQTLRLQPATTQTQTQTVTNKNIIVQSQQQNASNKPATSGNITTPNRVVLAVQGGGQIFLSPNFQGGNINLKSLQNMKVVSLAQHPSAKIKDVTSSTTSPSSITLSTQPSILKTTSAPTKSDTNI